jgi:hypothetical protein
MAEAGMRAGAGTPMMGVDAAGLAQFLQLAADGGLKLATVPAGATILTASSGNVANASAAATFPAVANVTNYVTGFTITGGGATAASLVIATLVGLLGGTASFDVAVPAGATLGLTPLVVTFPQPIPASAANTALVLTLPALGAGNTHAAVVMHGFKI